MDFDSTAVYGALVAVAETSSDGVLLVDRGGVLNYVNSAALAMMGLDSLDVAQATGTFALVAQDSLGSLERIQATVADTGRWDGPIGLVSARGRPMTVDMSVAALDESDGRGWMLVVMRDLRPERHRERDLVVAMEAVASRAKEQKVIADLNRIALTAEFSELSWAAVRAMVDMLGVEHAVMFRPSTSGGFLRFQAGIGSHSGDLVNAVIRTGTNSLAGYAMTSKSIVECRDARGEQRFDTATMDRFSLRSAVAVPVLSGDTVWGVLVAYRDVPHKFPQHAVTFVAMVAEVISVTVRRADLERELLYQSLHDPLTHLANRTLAYQRIDTALARCRAESVMTAVMLVDLHDFRTINDSFGHGAGDGVLTAVAPLLTDSVRMGDTVARFGGDEFLVVCGDLADSFDALTVAQKILARFRQPIPVDGHEVEVSACIGVAVGHGDDTAAEMVRHADIAVGEAKKEGPGTVHLFQEEQGDAALRRLTVASALREALQRDQLSLAYQPVFDLETGRIASFEALARWTNSEVGVIGPGEFVPIAERSGLILPLGEWALETACRAAARWQPKVPASVRVNVSPLQLRHAGFTGVVERVLSETGLPATQLGIEITESIWVEDTETVRRNLTAMHDMGVEILLDDFGIGHSSLGYLKRFPILDSVKIDRSFVADLPDRQAESIVRSIVNIARSFDLTVVGEGVETREQLDTLCVSGCDLGQGYLLGEPLTEDEVLPLVESTDAEGRVSIFG